MKNDVFAYLLKALRGNILIPSRLSALYPLQGLKPAELREEDVVF